MKILSVSMNADGHFNFLVEFQKTITAQEIATIPTREFAITQNADTDRGKQLEKMSDEEYIAEALEMLRQKLEVVPEIAPQHQTLINSIVGKEVSLAPKTSNGKSRSKR